MNTISILTILVSSLLSGLLGVIVSAWFYSRLERRKAKYETARRLFGNKHSIQSDGFKQALNEVIVIFADSRQVVEAVTRLFNVVETPLQSRRPNETEEAIINLMKAMCRDIGIKYRDLPDAYYLKYFGVQPH